MVRIGLEESEKLRKTCFINFLRVVNLDFSPLELAIGGREVFRKLGGIGAVPILGNIV